MRILASVIIAMEEATRRNEYLQWICPACTVLLVYTTLADKLWAPFKLLAFSPLITSAVFVVLYLIICIFYIPFWLLSFAVGSFGSFILFLVFVIMSLQSLGRCIAFPGSTNSVQREISADFFRKTMNKFDGLCQLIANFCAALLAFSTGKMRQSEVGIFQQKAQELLLVAEALLRLSEWLQNIQEEVSRSLTAAEYSSLQELTSSAVNLADQLGKMKMVISAVASGGRPSISSQDQASDYVPKKS